MCGIAGVFGQDDSPTVRKMLSTIIHRGPDDGFLVAGDDFSLGARRLSIVGVQNGRQPLSNETSTIWAAQNGELYNFPQVKPRLLANGHRLSTDSDTEILPHLYEEFGVDFVKKIDGMFAVAIWDDTQKQGVLARDRMGQKPLYYHYRDGVLYFGSEIKELLCIPGFDRQINLETLHHYLSYKHVPSPLSIFQGIHLLPPAHRLIFRLGEAPKVEPYWALHYGPTPETKALYEEDAIQELLRLLKQGVQRRLMADVPIGFFLSGGIDSSLTTALAAEMSDQPIKTFTLTYGDQSTTAGKEADRHWATHVANTYQTDHFEETIAFSHFPDTIGKVLSHFDEPFAGVISTYFLSALIAQHVKVAIAGDAADELFGSYRSHRLAFPLANYPTFRQQEDDSLIAPFEHEVAYLDQMYEPQDWAWRNKLLVLTDAEKLPLYHADVRAELLKTPTLSHLKGYFDQLTAGDPLNRILEMEYATIFPDQVLTFVDRLSMAHSLEVRSAFLDVDFVTFIASLPGNLKIKDGVTKYLLKKAALNYFPQEMLFRPKEGFLMPITQWIFHDLQDYVRQILSPAELNKHQIFDVQQVQTLIDQLYQGQEDYRQVNRIYALVIFQEWYNLYMA